VSTVSRLHQRGPFVARQIDRKQVSSKSSAQFGAGLHAASTGRALFVASTPNASSSGAASDLLRVAGGSGRAQQRGLYRVHSTTDVGVGNMDKSISARGSLRKVEDRQPPSTIDNETQPHRDLAGPGEVAPPVMVDMARVRMCRDELDAVNLCIDLSRMSDETLCRLLGIDKGHWSRMRKGRAHFPTAKRIALMELAGNWAPLQYELCRTPLIRQLRDEWEAELRARSKVTDESSGQRWYA
jgi:hypothetical protein